MATTEQQPITQPIPLVDLKSQFKSIKSQVKQAIDEVLERGDFVLGQAVTEFEGSFAEYCESHSAVGVGSGTEALHVACRAADIGPGDEVIVPAYTFIASALGVILAGAKPILVDVNPGDALIDPTRIEAAITPRTKAILPVHMFGQCADMDPILEIARQHRLSVIEDAAQAHGARYKGRRAGSFGDFGCFSFYPGKNLGAYGDGGAVTTQNVDNDRRLRSLRNLGSSQKYVHDEIGLNSRLDTLQAAVLNVKLPYLDAWNMARRNIASAYRESLACASGLRLPQQHCDREHVYHLFVVNTLQRDELLTTLNSQDIGAGIHYPKALHQHQAFAQFGYSEQDFPVAKQFAESCLSLPIYAELPERDFQRVVDTVTQAL